MKNIIVDTFGRNRVRCFTLPIPRNPNKIFLECYNGQLCEDILVRVDHLWNGHSLRVKATMSTHHRIIFQSLSGLGNEYIAVKNERDELRRNQDTVNNEREELRRHHDTVTNERDELRSKYNDVINESDELRSKYDDVINERDELRSKYEDVINERDELATKASHLQEELNGVSDQLKKAECDHDVEIDMMNKERESAALQIKNITDELDATKEQYTKSAEQLERHRRESQDKISAMESENEAVPKDMTNLQSQIKKLKKERDALVEESVLLKGGVLSGEEAKAKLLESQSKKEQLQSELDTTKQNEARLVEEVEALKIQLSSSAKEYEESIKSNISLRNMNM